MNDRDKANKLRAKGWTGPSASEKAKAKKGKGNSSQPAARGSVEQQLRRFDSSDPKGTAIPRSDESRQRARSHRRGLPPLG